jgi:hypothetical protein
LKGGQRCNTLEATVSADVPVLVITGTMGSGETTMLGEASDLLTARGITHAAVDLDTLGMGHLPEPAWADLTYRNLSLVWQNYAAVGAARLLIAEAVESVGELNRIREAVPGAQLVVCRLTAPLETVRRRVSQREPGMLREALIARVAELEVLIDTASLENFSLSTDDDRNVTEAALEMLSLANWIP